MNRLVNPTMNQCKFQEVKKFFKAYRDTERGTELTRPMAQLDAVMINPKLTTRKRPSEYSNTWNLIFERPRGGDSHSLANLGPSFVQEKGSTYLFHDQRLEFEAMHHGREPAVSRPRQSICQMPIYG
jgi:hypothetical protein